MNRFRHHIVREYAVVSPPAFRKPEPHLEAHVGIGLRADLQSPAQGIFMQEPERDIDVCPRPHISMLYNCPAGRDEFRSPHIVACGRAWPSHWSGVGAHRVRFRVGN